MKLYNTLSRQIDVLKPINEPEVTIYTCGPTVYDYPHIGNWFTFIRYDLLVRSLQALGYKTKWVLNITDVGHLVSDADQGEDKLVKQAVKENKDAWSIAKSYTDYFVEGLTRLNISTPDFMPKATEHIQEQIDFIKKLEDNKLTYKTCDGVYFDVAKFPQYIKLARLNLEDQVEGARVEINPEKHRQIDFALWKFSPSEGKRDMEWDSPWGKGFPGWHIECSAMALKYLGPTMDIHAGGIDHIPVHHTNEIAQSEAVNNKPLANIWFHTNHVSVNGKKISKSLGNGITLEDLESRNLPLDALRLLVIQSNYINQSQFTYELLNGAFSSLKNLIRDFSWIYSATINEINSNELRVKIKKSRKTILDYMADNLNTPRALSTLHDLASYLGNLNSISKEDIEIVENFGHFINSIFGINIVRKIDLSKDQSELIKERSIYRTKKEWEKADNSRLLLEKQGIGLRDVGESSLWFPLT
ncbi:MAG: cysteine--tRNA ligase [bacterium]